MTRRGKIARLPRYIRDELGERLENGEGGASLVAWLNSLSAVKEVLRQEFDGRDITEGNLSEWRLGGYQDWLAHREAENQMNQLVSEADDLKEIRDNRPLTDQLARLVTLRYAALLANKNGEADDRHKVRALRALLRDIIDLRRSDLNAARVAMEQQRWDIKLKELDEKEEALERSEEKDALLAPIRAAMRAKMLAQVYGGERLAKNWRHSGPKWSTGCRRAFFPERLVLLGAVTAGKLRDRMGRMDKRDGMEDTDLQQNSPSEGTRPTRSLQTAKASSGKPNPT